jgi:hypothetical protein
MVSNLISLRNARLAVLSRLELGFYENDFAIGTDLLLQPRLQPKQKRI